MSKLETISDADWQRLYALRAEWEALGQCTDRANRPLAEAAMTAMYQRINHPAPRYVWCDSPLGTSILPVLLQQSNIVSLRASLRASLGVSLWASLWASLRASLGDSLRDSLRASLGVSLGNHWYWGTHDGAWIAYYMFCGSLPLSWPYTTEAVQLLAHHNQYAKSALWANAYQSVCFISDRPTRVAMRRLSTEGPLQLHATDGPAIAFADGFSVYALHGVRVPSALVETSADTLDVREWVVEQSNAEIRREAVRKIGIERVCAELGATVIDRGTDHAGQPCELLLLDIGDNRKRPYIKLRNPSIGVYHLEGIHPDCTTIDAAFRFRNGRKEAPSWIK